jgi:hypothetical protein
MPPRPCNRKLLPLLLLVATMAVLLTGCSLLSTSLCKEGDALVAAAQPARVLEVYARAKVQGDGCSVDGLEVASANQRQAVEEAARGEAAERAGGIPVAPVAYQAALTPDVTNALAVAGLARLGQPQPIPPPPVATPPPDPSWWASPWPYFLGSVLVSALFAGAVLWFVKRQIALGRELTELLEHIESKDTAILAAENVDQELWLQKELIDDLTELIDMFAQIQAEPTSEVVVWLKPPSVAEMSANELVSDEETATGTEGGASADAAIGAGDMRVTVNVFAIESSHGQAVRKQLVIQRVIERVMERDEAERIVSSAYGYEATLSEQEPGPIEKATADRIVDPVWIRIESWWITPDYQGLAEGAKWIKGVEDSWHDLVLGKPAERVALGTGFSPASAHVIKTIMKEISLPCDGLFKGGRRLLQYTGIVLGAVSGTALLTNACVSSLAQDLLAETTARALRKAIVHVLVPVRSAERPTPASEPGPDGAQARPRQQDETRSPRRGPSQPRAPQKRAENSVSIKHEPAAGSSYPKLDQNILDIPIPTMNNDQSKSCGSRQNVGVPNSQENPSSLSPTRGSGPPGSEEGETWQPRLHPTFRSPTGQPHLR